MPVSEGNWTNGTIEDEVGRTPRMVFLALIMLLSCVVNVLLLFAFVHNRKARQNVQSVTVINLAAVCLGDCVLNMSLVMGSLTAGHDWTFSDPLCKWHSFVMSLVLAETSLLVTVLVCDRFLAVKYLEKYDSLISPVRVIIVLVFTWIQSLAFSFPFFLNTVKTTFQLKLHTCSVSDETSLVFICMASVLCFLVPALVNVIMFVRIFHLSYKQKQEVKIIMTQNHYCDQVKQEPALWQEMCTVKYVGVLCLLWFVLEVPHIVTTYIQQYRLSSQLSFSMDYPWGVDVAFIWMRFAFSALFPCVTFVWRKDLWHSCKEHLVCHRSNSVLDIKVTVDPTAKTAAARPKTLPPAVKVPPKPKERDQPRAEGPNLLSFNVPVLFATSDGIHIETPCSDASEAEDADADLRDHKPKGRQLDITSHSIDHNRLPGDTSDYDSEEEYYSSRPLSTRHIRGALENNSASNLCGEDQHERGAPANTTKLTSSQGADSGLELSGTMGSSSEKGTQEMISSNDCEHADSRLTATAIVAHTTTEASISRDDGDSGQKSDISNSTTVVHKDGDRSKPHPDSKNSDKAEQGKARPQPIPAPLPKAGGRLKPLHLARPPKLRTEWPEKKITMKSQDRKKDGASAQRKQPDAEAAGGADRGTEQSSDRPGDSDRRSEGTRPSRGRGHKRTMTSDSERALLSSDSSMEIQMIKVHSCKAQSEQTVTKPE